MRPLLLAALFAWKPAYGWSRPAIGPAPGGLEIGDRALVRGRRSPGSTPLGFRRTKQGPDLPTDSLAR